MKTTEIRYLNQSQIGNLVVELFGQIEIIYSISLTRNEKPNAIISYFADALKKQYDYLTFEQLHQAFEANGYGFLDIYLPKIGNRADNKIKSFNIPDLTKVINAHIKQKKLLKVEGLEKKEFSEKEKYEIRQKWCEQFIGYFELYRDEKKVTHLKLPFYTAKTMVKIGLLYNEQIDYKERRTNILSNSKYNANEILVYECFDRLIEKNEHLNDYLNDFRNGNNTDGLPF